MEIVFYVVMVMWGLYLVVSEPLENVERDFGIRKQYGGSDIIREWYCSDVWILIVDREYEVVMMVMWLIGAVLVVLVMVGFGSGFQTGSSKLTGSMRGSTRIKRSHGPRDLGQVQTWLVEGPFGTRNLVEARLPKVTVPDQLLDAYSRTLDELDAQDPKQFPTRIICRSRPRTPCGLPYR